MVYPTWNISTCEDYKEDFSYDRNGNIEALTRNAAGTQVMDQLAYTYNKQNGKLLNNKLNVLDDVADSNTPGELQGTTNYSYDVIGNIIQEKKGENLVAGFDWTVYGKISKVTKTTAAENITYGYDATGNRVSKTINSLSTWYVRDSQGNLLGLYDNASGGVNWKEQQLYRSSRLGMWKPNFNLALDSARIKWSNTSLKFFELSNHLGNVMSVINDTFDSGTYSPTVINAQDYYAFGSVMPGRSYSISNNATYRYGFNGKENDNEIKVSGNSIDFGARMYDSRLGRFLSTDPLEENFAWNSPYSYAENDVIRSTDLDGLEKLIYIYNFTADKITKTKIELPKAGPLGNGVLVQSNHNGKNHFYYGKELADKTITGFKKAYEGAKLNAKGDHVGCKDSKGNPTIGYGHLIKKGKDYKVGSTITEKQAKALFETDMSTIKATAEKKLSAYTLNENQNRALLDAAFNMGPGKLSQFNMDDGKFSGENFFFKFMGDGDGISKRRFGENLLYSEGLFIPFDVLKGKKNLGNAEKAIEGATAPAVAPVAPTKEKEI